MVGFALVHSPFLGPGCWRRVEASLTDQGAAAIAVDYGGLAGPSWYEATARQIALGVASIPDAFLVLHSAAGGFAPSIVDQLGAIRPAGLIFVDAILPHPGRSWLDTAPAPLSDHLRTVAVEDHLPPWNRWFARDPTEKLIPDRTERVAFASDLPNVPAAYLQAPAPDLESWRSLTASFVQLSRAYDNEAAAAARMGWIITGEESDHLAMITRPDTVAATLLAVSRRMA